MLAIGESAFFCTPPPPAIQCPTNIVRECTNAAGNIVIFAASATSTCNSNVTIACLPPSGTRFAPGTTTVTCTALATNTGLSNSCSFTIKVLDTTPPAITCPANIVAGATNSSGTAVTFSVTATDTCDTNVIVVCAPASGSLFPTGTNIVRCTATDDAGNTNGCAFTVRLTNMPPVIVAQPQNKTNCVGTPVTFSVSVSGTTPFSYQWKKGGVAVAGATSSSYSIPSVQLTDAGSYTVAITNAGSGTTSAGATLIVNTTPATPTITPTPSSVCANSTGNQASGPAGATTYSWTISNGTFASATNIQTITYTAGASGNVGLTLRVSNASGCTAANSINVPIPPDAMPPTVTCSTNITVTATGNCPVVVNFTVSGTDNCSLSNVVANPPSGSTFPVGTNTVTVTARDAAGNTNTCTFKVTVLAGLPPLLSVSYSGTNVVLCWPRSYGCYALQYAPRLISPPATNAWTNYPGPFTTNSSSICVTNSVGTTNRFFRLAF